MVDVVSKRCIHPGCKKRSTFNKEGEHPIYCATHRQEGMINVTGKRCIHPDCKKQPNYNKEGERPIYCGLHRQEGMINVTGKRCIHPGCKIQSHYNKEGERPIYCGIHRQEGMVNVTGKRCIHPGCKTQPHYNTLGETKGIYCVSHKTPYMVNVTAKTCKTHLCSTLITDKYDGYCFYCYMNLFPDKPVTRNYKTKEYSVVEYVKTNYPQLWIADKITGGCSRRRPDLLLDLMDQVLIIEVDENQHIDYDCSCENKRIMELSQDLAHRPIVFIRFNPDDYEKDGTKVSSCWGVGKKGLFIVKPTKKVEWEQRLRALGETIEYWIANRTDKTVEIIQLFYDSI
jgi:plastocyanin